MTWLKRMPVRTCNRTRQLGQRPALEHLEDRTLLSTCHVNRLVDMGVGKGFRGDFRYCLTKANADPGEDLIIFGVQGTINLNGALPAISDDLIIAGPGADLLTVRRDTGGEYRIFTIPEGVNAQIYSITMTNGRPAFITKPKDRWGRGIYNSGTLTLGSVAIVGNTAPNAGGLAGHGGGIFNDGVLLMTSSLVANNHVSGIGAFGGGIDNFDAGSVTVINSTISGNTVQETQDASDYKTGGGISSDGDLVIRNSTIAGNRVIDAQGQLEGFGSGIRMWDGVFEMHNTILSGNSALASRDLSGGIDSSGYNLIGNSAGGSGYLPTDILDTDPLLGPLANNGGPTLTHGLLPDSPAIDAGDNTDAPEWDQRGPGFPRIVNGTIDIGAFEVQSSPAPLPTSLLHSILITAVFDDR